MLWCVTYCVYMGGRYEWFDHKFNQNLTLPVDVYMWALSIQQPPLIRPVLSAHCKTFNEMYIVSDLYTSYFSTPLLMFSVALRVLEF